MPRLLFTECTREDIRSRAEATLLVVPTGSTEQHGPHLPLGTDTFTVEYIATQAAEKVAPEIPVLVAPTIPIGASHHHLPFGGTLSISTETYYRVMYDIVESAILGGFRRIFIINGHGGNHELLQLVIRDLSLRHKVWLAAASYWHLALDELAQLGANTGGRIPGHAGAFETSQMLALRPDLVGSPPTRLEEATGNASFSSARPYRVETYGAWQNIDGFTDSPNKASMERGRKSLDASVRALARALRDFYQKSQTP
jgi:creatinine amidohydrolase